MHGTTNPKLPAKFVYICCHISVFYVAESSLKIPFSFCECHVNGDYKGPI